MTSIDIERLRGRMEALAAIGADPGGGITRYAFSPEERAAKDLVGDMLRAAGLSTFEDAAGNLFGRLEGAEADAPALIVGSHIDTVPNGGMFDGALGVMAAVECVHAIAASGTTIRHPIEVVAFTDEEGARFRRGVFGSKAFTGVDVSPWAQLRDVWGQDARSVMAAGGVDADRLSDAEREPATVLAFLELHIEQGEVLSSQGERVGIVEGIVGIRRLVVRFDGVANHAGTTPMAMRRDALLAGAELALATEAIAVAAGAGAVGTVGTFEVTPGAANVIPGSTELNVEFRALDPDVLARCIVDARERARGIASTRQLAVELEETVDTPPVMMDSRLVDRLVRAARASNTSVLRMPSGAGHDAMILAQRYPTAMLFVPSRDGISHNPAEWTDWDDIGPATQLLCDTMIDVATRGL